ncbi:MAG: cobalamin-binding protein [Deltaproteobacteria bacterium]|nr:cobalamin-binding protein [Deltaproteobacteria bacterium]MBW2306819.1 cobalamin-binding protein [Deltaproteobacteria bacterium]
MIASLLFSPCDFALGLTDEMGRTVAIGGTPARIIALAPSITEILFVVGAGGRVVGVSQNSEFPEAARNLPRVGPYHRPNLEKIIALQPDLVIATADGTPKALVDELDRLEIPTYAINPGSVEQIVRSIRNIGVAVRAPNTETVAQKMEKAIACIRNAVKKVTYRPKVLYQLGLNPLVSAGKGTFSDNVITLAGGLNLARDLSGKYPRLSMEQIIIQRPDVIIASTMGKPVPHSKLLEQWRRWGEIPAVKNGRVYGVNSDLIDRPSPRCIHGVMAVLRMLHPRVAEEVGRCLP